MRRFLLLSSILAVPCVFAQPARSPADSEVHVLPVQGSVFMMVGAGGNIAVQVGSDGVLLVDTGLPTMTDKVDAAIRKLSDRPIRYILNTHMHPDHTGGNEKLAKLGSTIAGGNVVGDIGQSAGQGAAVIAHENVLKRMSETAPGQPATPFGALPTDTFAGPLKSLFFNGEAVRIMHMPHAHTDGDSMIFFRRSDVLVTGDIFTPGGYPVIDLARGGNVQGIIAALNQIIQLAVPAEKQEGGTYIIPGHGRLCDQADVVEYRDMLTIIRDRIQDSIKKGLTLDQVKAAKPTFDYDPLYGSTSGFWTTDQFIEAVYKSLTPASNLSK